MSVSDCVSPLCMWCIVDVLGVSLYVSPLDSIPPTTLLSYWMSNEWLGTSVLLARQIHIRSATICPLAHTKKVNTVSCKCEAHGDTQHWWRT